jgi:hypothetical protein
MLRDPAGLRILSEEWEPFLRILPRPLLRWLEVHARSGWISNEEWIEILEFWKNRRVALVRQTAYEGGYLRATQGDWLATVLTARAHLGPMAFLSELGADAWIVRECRDPETQAWRGKHLADPDPEASFQRIRRWQQEQETLSRPADCQKIRWKDYDLVVSLDVAVPARVTRRARRTVWAYYSVEAGGPLHKSSLVAPVQGYHFYLNHSFRRFRARPSNRSHVIEFPFSFQSRAGWEKLRRAVRTPAKRNGIVTDRATWNQGGSCQGRAWRQVDGDAREYVRLMGSRSFAVRTDPAPRWGNWAVESILAGCLFVGSAQSLAMPGLLLPELLAESPSQAAELVRRLSAQPARLKQLRELQLRLTEHLVFRRPLADLTRAVRQIRP